MKQVEYRGYARGGGFNPVQVPDSTGPMQKRDRDYQRTLERYASQRAQRDQQTVSDLNRLGDQVNRREQDYIQSLDRRRQQDLQNRDQYQQALARYQETKISQRNAYEQALRRKFSTEADNRDQNFSWEQREAVRQQNAILQNLDIRRQDAARKLDSFRASGGSQRDIETLGKSISSIAEALGTIREQQVENAEVEWENTVFEYGITPQMRERYEQQRNQLLQGEAGLKQSIEQMEFEGVPVTILEKMRNASGLKKVAMNAVMLQTGGQNYPVFLAELESEFEYEAGGRRMTLADARQRGDIAGVRAGLTAIRTRYLRFFRGQNPVALNDFLFEPMREVEQRYLSESLQVLRENSNKRVGEDRTREMSMFLGRGGQGMLEYINLQGGDPSSNGYRSRKVAARDEAIAYIIAGVQSGEIDRNKLDEIARTEFIPDGQDTPVTMGEYWARQGFGEAYVELEKTERRAYERSQQDRQRAIEELTDIARQRVLEGPLTEADLEAFRQRFIELGADGLPKVLRDAETVAGMTQEALTAELQTLADRGVLTEGILDNPKYAQVPGLVSRFRSVAQANQQAAESGVDFKGTAKLINGVIRDYIGLTDTDVGSSPQYLWASMQAERMLRERFQAGIAQGRDPQTALDEAREYVLTEFKLGTQSNKDNRAGAFLADNDREKVEFRGFNSVTGRDKVDEQIDSFRDEIRFQGPALVGHRVMLSENGQKQLMNFKNGFTTVVPSEIRRFAAATGLEPLTIINGQLQAMGQEPFVVPELEEANAPLSPAMKRLRDYRPSSGTTYQAYGASQDPYMSESEIYRPLLNLIASRESKAYGEYDAMNTGGNGNVVRGSANSRDVFGRGLSQMTVGEVLNLQRSGRLHAAGRYQMIYKTLNYVVNEGGYGDAGVSIDDPFDAATQDRLAIHLLRARAGKFLDTGSGLDRAVVGMGNEWSAYSVNERPEAAAEMREALLATRNQIENGSHWRMAQGIHPSVRQRIYEESAYDVPTRSVGVMKVANSMVGLDTSYFGGTAADRSVYGINRILKKAGINPPWGKATDVGQMERALLTGNGKPVPGPEPGAIVVLGGGGQYVEGGWGKHGSDTYGLHFDIKRSDGADYGRNNLDSYVRVNGQPLSTGKTVKGGEYGAPRDYGPHAGWDYAFGVPGGPQYKLELVNGARWIGTKWSSVGNVSTFRIPTGETFEVIHGTMDYGNDKMRVGVVLDGGRIATVDDSGRLASLPSHESAVKRYGAAHYWRLN